MLSISHVTHYILRRFLWFCHQASEDAFGSIFILIRHIYYEIAHLVVRTLTAFFAIYSLISIIVYRQAFYVYHATWRSHTMPPLPIHDAFHSILAVTPLYTLSFYFYWWLFIFLIVFIRLPFLFQARPPCSMAWVILELRIMMMRRAQIRAQVHYYRVSLSFYILKTLFSRHFQLFTTIFIYAPRFRLLSLSYGLASIFSGARYFHMHTASPTIKVYFMHVISHYFAHKP